MANFLYPFFTMFCTILFFQVAEVVLQETQTVNLSVVTHLMTILTSRNSEELKGFMCIVCHMISYWYFLITLFSIILLNFKVVIWSVDVEGTF